jgi:hypothetical protein
MPIASLANGRRTTSPFRPSASLPLCPMILILPPPPYLDKISSIPPVAWEITDLAMLAKEAKMSDHDDGWYGGRRAG